MALAKRLRRAATRGPIGPGATVLWVAAAVAVPTLLRLGLNALVGDAHWYPTYYPATLLATIFLGWEAGVAVVLLSAATAVWLFTLPATGFSAREMAAVAVFVSADSLIVLSAGLLRATLIRLEAANRREKALNNELQHRLKNTLAVVQGLMRQTLKHGHGDAQALEAALTGRIHALSRAHDVLATGSWEACALPDLATQALEPFRADGQIAARGPDCVLYPESCVPLVLALHELATNAVKHGALSSPRGRVDLTWSPTGAAEAAGLTLVWTERDGPPVKGPSRKGLGTRLLTRQAGLEDVRLAFRPSGVVCEIDVRLPRGVAAARA